jgi:hypothetical protein
VRNWGKYNLDYGNLGFPFWQNLGFLVDTKLGVSNKLSCSGGTNLGGDLEIIDFMVFVEEKNDLRWWRM